MVRVDFCADLIRDSSNVKELRSRMFRDEGEESSPCRISKRVDPLSVQ